MPFSLPTFEQIRTAIITDWRNSDPTITVDNDSDNFVRASGVANAILGLYQYLQWAVNQIWPDTQDWDNLVRFGQSRNINPRPAVRAVGNARFTGTVNTVIPAGTIILVGKINYRTIVASAINAQQTATVAVTAIDAGIGSNLSQPTAGRLQSAPLGISADVMLLDMVGGVDQETQRSYLERVLDRLRLPPAGGTRHDYETWAKEVPGVSYVQVYPLRRGLGKVDVVVLFNGVPASAAERLAVYNYIDARSPAGGEFMVATYTLISVPITATLTLAANTVTATVRAAAQTGLAAYFTSLKPGESVARSRLLLILSDIAGVVDVTITAPAASVNITVDATRLELATLGPVNLVTQ